MSNKTESSAYENGMHQQEDLRVCMLCEVLEVGDCLLTVRPAYSERVMDEQGRTVSHSPMGEIIDVPVPVIMQIKYYPEVGDHGFLIFHDVAIDEYIVNGGTAELNEQSRSHDYSDALFVPADYRCDKAKDPIMTIRDGRIEVDDIFVDGQSVKNHVHRHGTPLTSTMQ